MIERHKLRMDGLKKAPPEDFHSFIKRPMVIMDKRYDAKHPNPQKSWKITIPIQIVRRLNLEKDDVLLVAIKKASEQEKEEYLVKE